jgi:hypothetical protein
VEERDEARTLATCHMRRRIHEDTCHMRRRIHVGIEGEG